MRSPTGVSFQVRKAAWPAFTAASTSAAGDGGTCVSKAAVAGFLSASSALAGAGTLPAAVDKVEKIALYR